MAVSMMVIGVIFTFSGIAYCLSSESDRGLGVTIGGLIDVIIGLAIYGLTC